MENQIYSLSAQQSNQYSKRIQRHNENLRTVKKNLEDEMSKKGKVELFGKAGSTSEVLQVSGETLENTLKIGIESEQIAIDTMNNLKKQRGQILNINEKVNDVGVNITIANRTITTMDRRRIAMKMIMMATIVLLVIAFVICLYIKIA